MTWTQSSLRVLFLSSFCHRNAANHSDFLDAAKRAEVANIEQLKSIIPLTGEISLVQDVCELESM